MSKLLKNIATKLGIADYKDNEYRLYSTSGKAGQEGDKYIDLTELLNDGKNAYANLAAFPTTGNPDNLYLAKDTKLIYYWTGSAYSALPIGIPNVYWKYDTAQTVNHLDSAGVADGTIYFIKGVAGVSIKNNGAVTGTNKPILLQSGTDYLFSETSHTILVYNSVDQKFYEVGTLSLHTGNVVEMITNQSTPQQNSVTTTYASGSVYIDWGDGSAPELMTSGAAKTHTYSVVGTYTMRLYGNIEEITALKSNGNVLTDVKNLEQLTSITEFELYNNSLTGDWDFTSLTGLTKLLLSGNDIINLDCTGLSNLVTGFGQTGTVGEFNESGNSNVVSINLTDCRNVNGVTANNKSSLVYVNVTNCTSATTIRLNDNSLANLIGINTCTGTTSLILSNNQFTTFDFQNLGLLTNCELNGNSINSLSNYTVLTSLTSFKLQDNNLAGAWGFTALTAIVSLYLGGNDITSLDVSGLSNMVNGFAQSGTTGEWNDSGNSNVVSMNFSGCTSLASLSSYNRSSFITLNLTNCTSLIVLRAHSNSLGVVSGLEDTVLTTIELQNNAMTAAEVNENLVNVDTIGNSSGNYKIEGTNAAPDGSSGGFDGTTAVSNLTGRSWIVTTS